MKYEIRKNITWHKLKVKNNGGGGRGEGGGDRKLQN